MPLRPSLMSLAALALSLSWPGGAVPADLLLLHGHIYTADPAMPWARAIAVNGSVIEAVGSDAQVLTHRRRHSRILDLQGRTVIPGIIDSHLHFLFGAMELHGVNLSTPESSITPDQPEALMTRLRTYAAEHPQDKIVFGRGDFSATPPFAPSRELLDRAIPDRPVVIHGTFEHSLWLNSKALALAGITDRPVADPAEERNVLRDASGHPSGVLIESAMELMERAVQHELSFDEKLDLLREASRHLSRFGITSAVNATGDLAEIKLYAALRDRGELTVRTRTAFGAVAVPHHLSENFLGDLETARRSYHDEWVSANLVKFFADGSTGQFPPLVYAAQDFRALVAELDRRGFQVMTHAERPDSVHMVLDAYQAAAQANGPRDRRWRLEHVYVTDTDDIRRFQPLAVIASMQPIFCCSETGTNFDPRERNPSDRWRTFAGSGARLAFGSDWPCSWPVNPFPNLQEAVTREIWHSADTENLVNQGFDGAAQAGGRPTGQVYSPEERLNIVEGVDAFTRNAAYAAYVDDRVGTLQAGKLADLAVLSQDIFSAELSHIGATRVLLTMVGGKTVYEETK